MPSEIQVDIWRFFHILLDKKVTILAIGLIAFLLAYAFTTEEIENVYLAQATIYSTASGGHSLAQAEATTNAMQRYAEVARSQKVLNRAASLMNNDDVTADDLADIITVSFQKDVSFLYIKARSGSPALSISAANAVAVAFVLEITAIVGQNTAQVLDEAVTYEEEMNGKTIQWMMRVLALFLGIFCSSLAIVLRDFLSSRVKSLRHATLNGSLKIIGVIPDFASKKER